MECGRKDENHIGGLSLMLPLVMVFGENKEYALKIALRHLALTHGGPAMVSSGKIIAKIILEVLCGNTLEQAILDHYPDGRGSMPATAFESLMSFPDQMVVGRHFSSACYIEHSIPATLFLALKYLKNPEQGLISNTMCGGDNAGRGAFLDALLGAAGGVSCWPEKWLNGLIHPPEMVLVFFELNHERLLIGDDF